MKAWKKLLLVLSFAVLSSGVFTACGLETSLSVKYMVGDKEYVVQKYDLNDTIALPKDPTEEGKRFIGWYTDPECTVPYAEGSVTAGFTLYAKFEASVVFIIVNTNGGEKINMISVKPGEPYSVPDAVKPGHTFTGYYYVDANGETQEFPSEGVLAEAKDIVIFASYTVNKYTVTLHNGYGDDEVVEVEYNKTYAPKAVVRPGYTFVAWHTVESGQSEETVYDESKPITQNVDLYAEYTANPYKITLVDSDSLETLAEVDVTFDSQYTLSAPTKEGYSVSAYTFNGAAFATTGSYTYASDIRVSVKYEKNRYNVSYVDADGNTLDTQTVVHGEKAVEPTVKLYKAGYTYALSANATQAITANTEITVTYTANPYKLTITNNVNSEKKILDVVYDGDYALTADEIIGYTFSKFTLDGADFTATGKYTYTYNLSLVANYTKNSYTVTFVDADGNTLDTQTVVHGEKAVIPSLTKFGYTYELSANATQAITENTEITVTYTAKPVTITVLNAGDYTAETTTFGATFTLQAPTRTGYIFQGFKGSDGKTYDADVTYTCDFENLILTAQWDGDNKTVTFIANGTQYGEAVEVLNGSAVTKPAQDPEKVGHTFKGWSVNRNAYEAYDFSQAVSEDFALYAYFTPNPYYIFIDLDGGVGETKVDVTYGAAYSLTPPTKKGYLFNGYVDADGNAYTKTETYDVAGDASLKATWKEDYKSVIFHVDDEETAQQVLNGFTVSQPSNPVKTGYTFKGWSTKQNEFVQYDFSKEVTETLALYAYFTANAYYIRIELDGGVGATQIDVIYGESYADKLVAPTKKGYTFSGYVYANDNSAYTPSSTYDVVGNTYLKATWTEDKETVVFYADGAIHSETTVLNGSAVSAPATQPSKVGYTFQGWSTKQGEFEAYDFNSEVADTLALYAYFAPNVYTITVYDMNGNVVQTEKVAYGTIPAINMNLTNDQLTFNGYYTKYDGQYAEKINFNLPYLYTEDLVVYQWWENPDDGKITDDLKQNGDYFIENNNDEWGTYVFLVGHTYTFKSTTITANVAQDFATLTTADGNTQLVALKAGEFVVTVSKLDGTSYERTIKIVEKVFTFTTGEDYKGAWVNRNAKNWNNNEKGDLMTAGRTNFIPDVKVQKLENGKLVALDFASANVEIKVQANGTDTTDYTLTGNAFTFGSSIASGSTVTLTMSPRYAIYKGQTVTFNFVLNDAVNVYTSQEMRRYYEDTSVREINVLRNIKVEMQADQLYYGNNPAHRPSSSNPHYNGFSYDVPADLVAPINKQGGYAAFDRYSGNLTVNGNYFTVDGSAIPLVDNRLGDWMYGASNDGLIIQNVQFSIFKFGYDDGGTTMSNDLLQMNNLYVLGNMTLSTNWGQNDGETYTINVNGNAHKVLTMSGAAIGIQARQANVSLDNVTVRRCVLGVNAYGVIPRSNTNPVTNSGHSVSMGFKDCLVENCWANDIYMYGFGKITLDSCSLGVCSGSAIHVDALPSPIAVTPEVHLINGTTVENWVTGGETWFNVYNMTGVVQPLKSQTEQGVASATSNYLTILKNKDDAQYFNFVFLMKGTPNTTDWADGKDDVGKATVIVEGENSLEELNGQAEAVGNQYFMDNMGRIDGVNVTQESLMAEATQYATMWVLKTAQTVEVAPPESMTSMFGTMVAYLGAFPRG